eukprot:TRINITY_DN113097_c0_g1_i1.p1 TRINITY_DN113097_c0_g1~~TRINITY_DN113097_c0_g1_i1.p1  ORF type:complete len:299 (-),score=56.40 TRINITY_DN113097_c0_g1_i1:33-929(-)
MGCASSNGLPVEHPVQVTQIANVSHAQSQQLLARAQAQQRGGGGQQGGGTGVSSFMTAPLMRSLVSLKRDSCALEKDETGQWFLQFRFASLATGTATASFLTSGGDEAGVGKGLVAPEASQSTEMRFEVGKSQAGRLFLCSDLASSLEGFKAEEGKHHAMLDLRADSTDPKAVTAQRSFLKLSAEGSGEVHIEKQLVQCGNIVRCFDSLYGTVPNPRKAEQVDLVESKATDEGGDCVICLTNPREVAILHCRHVCLCVSCAQVTSSTWSFQCPVCRGRVAAMVGVKEPKDKVAEAAEV